MSKEQKITSPDQAVGVLIQAVKIGQAKGAFSLEDASLIALAIKALVPEQPELEGEPSAEEPVQAEGVDALDERGDSPAQ